MTSSGSPQDSPGPSGARPFAGFWRRAAAALLDGLILGLGGYLLGQIFFEFLAQLGPWGRLVGFCIALLYFGVLNSHIGHGQTLGNRILGIQVLQLDASELPFSRSVLRYSVLAVPFFVNNLSLPVSRTPASVLVLLTIIVFGVGGTAAYLLLFNRPSRRSLHDFAAGSIVVRKGAATIPPPRLWRGHLAYLSGLFALLAVASVLIGKLVNQPLMSDLRRVLGAVESSSSVRSAGVFAGRRFGPQVSSTFVRVTALLRDHPVSLDEISDEIASIVLEEYPQAAQSDLLQISVAYGFDIGIASSYRHHHAALGPEQWRGRLGVENQ